MFNKLVKLVRNARGRDSQRGKLYKAERRAQRRFPHPGADVSTPDLYRTQLNAIMATQWMRDNFPKAAADPVSVKFNPRMGGAHAGKNGITTGTKSWTMNMLILCHELAHTIVRRQYGTSMYVDEQSGKLVRSVFGLSNYSMHFIAGHGPEYADVYLRLVREFIGYEQFKILREEFDASRIRYVAPEQYNTPMPQPAIRLAYASRAQAVRNSNPSVSAKVRVTASHFERPTIYPSVRVAFAALQLPMNQHQKFRKELKLNGTNQIGAFTFTTISKE